MSPFHPFPLPPYIDIMQHLNFPEEGGEGDVGETQFYGE